MSAMKNLISDILEALQETSMDYELVAEMFGMSPADVYSIALNYGDV